MASVICAFAEEAPASAGRFIFNVVEPLRELDDRTETYSLAFLHDPNHHAGYTELYTSGTMEVAFQNLGLDPQKLLNDLVEVYSASIALNMPFDPNAVPIKTVKDLLEALYMRKKSIRQDQLFRLQTEITRLQAKA